MPEEDIEDVEIDSYLDSDESIDDLLKEEYSPQHEPNDEFFKDLHPENNATEDDLETPASPDERLIRGKGIALTNIESDEELDEEISKEEETLATYAQDEFDNPALNSVYKATMEERAVRERQIMDKRELLELAGDMVDEYFRKNVETDGIDESKLNQLKFAARRRVANKLSDD